MLHVIVKPGSKLTVIEGHCTSHLIIRLNARPVENAANDELLRFLRKVFKLKGIIAKGSHSREKVVLLDTSRSEEDVYSLLSTPS